VRRSEATASREGFEKVEYIFEELVPRKYETCTDPVEIKSLRANVFRL
jgi:hypothetical protein